MINIQFYPGKKFKESSHFSTDISIPVEPADLTIHSIASSGGRVHFGTSEKGDDIASLYGTPKEEIPPTSAGMKSDNGATSFNFTAGNQVPSL